MSQFKSQYNLDQRREQCAKINRQYPGRVPVIVEPYGTPLTRVNGDNLKSKYLIPEHQTFAAFMVAFRSNAELNPEQSIYFIASDNVVPSPSQTVAQFARQHKADDGFLYLYYVRENTFG